MHGRGSLPLSVYVIADAASSASAMAEHRRVVK